MHLSNMLLKFRIWIMHIGSYLARITIICNLVIRVLRSYRLVPAEIEEKSSNFLVQGFPLEAF